MKYKIVVADVDGTLIAPGGENSENISPRLINAVKETQKRGVVFSLATARSLDRLVGLVKKLKLNSPIILDNGARIYDCLVEKYIYNSFIPQKNIGDILSVLKQFNYTIYIDDVKIRNVYHAGNPQNYTDVVKIVILHVSPREAQEIFETVSRNRELQVTKSVSGENPVKESIHITSFEAAKEKALKRIADLLGVNMQEVLTIGDSYNDLFIMKASGFKVAMGNSVPEIKAIADYIAPGFNEDGVAHVLEKFILKNNE